MKKIDLDKLLGEWKQTKDIPDEYILDILVQYQGQWAFWAGNELWFRDKKDNPIIVKIYSDDFPPKLIHSKFKSLVKRKLIGGCSCGCRGDFEITDLGLRKIGAKRIKPYNGY